MIYRPQRQMESPEAAEIMASATRRAYKIKRELDKARNAGDPFSKRPRVLTTESIRVRANNERRGVRFRTS